eukprot:6348423-Amphidinium_carterae.1
MGSGFVETSHHPGGLARRRATHSAVYKVPHLMISEFQTFTLATWSLLMRSLCEEHDFYLGR